MCVISYVESAFISPCTKECDDVRMLDSFHQFDFLEEIQVIDIRSRSNNLESNRAPIALVLALIKIINVSAKKYRPLNIWVVTYLVNFFCNMRLNFEKCFGVSLFERIDKGIGLRTLKIRITALMDRGAKRDVPDVGPPGRIVIGCRGGIHCKRKAETNVIPAPALVSLGGEF